MNARDAVAISGRIGERIGGRISGRISRRGGRDAADLDGPLDPDLPLHLLVVMALSTEAERLVPDGRPGGAPPP